MAALQTQTVLSGVDGSLAFASLRSGVVPGGKIQSWNLGIYQVINNITGFDSTGYNEFLGGCKGASWSAVMHHKYNAGSTSPFGPIASISTIPADAINVMPMGGMTSTFTLGNGGTACSIAWVTIIQAHGVSQDVTGDSISALSGPCSGTPTLSWDET